MTQLDPEGPRSWLGVCRQRADGVDYEIHEEISASEFEQCCDDIAVSITANRSVYVEALAALEEMRIAAVPALSVTGSGASQLVARIQRLHHVAVRIQLENRYGNAAARIHARHIHLRDRVALRHFDLQSARQNPLD